MDAENGMAEVAIWTENVTWIGVAVVVCEQAAGSANRLCELSLCCSGCFGCFGCPGCPTEEQWTEEEQVEPEQNL
jgi:hypothetical protein